MIAPDLLFQALTQRGIRFFAGVPDSLLKDFCAYVTDHTDARSHVITANEGGAVALAAGHYLATGSPGLVYMQNSGQGNAVNPLVSLADADVFGIPILLLIGWRGEPGTKDEPQHAKQGKITRLLLDTLGIDHVILPAEAERLAQSLDWAAARLQAATAPVALVVRAGTFERYRPSSAVKPPFELTRESALAQVLHAIGPRAAVVSTTGMTSRELFETRQREAQDHHADFRTVGCMGHASQIALGIALAQPEREVYCLDGDGAVVMHMGALAIIGSQAPVRLRHVVFNNGAHDSVGGQPTAGFAIDIPAIARACGYRLALTTTSAAEVSDGLRELAGIAGPTLLEIKVKTGARSDLGRPSVGPSVNKLELMAFLRA